jgi:hypothetical protein
MHKLGSAINMGATVAPSLGTSPGGNGDAIPIKPPSQTPQLPQGPLGPTVTPKPGGQQ